VVEEEQSGKFQNLFQTQTNKQTNKQETNPDKKTGLLFLIPNLASILCEFGGFVP